MANRPQALAAPPLRTYTRADFTALRAFVQQIPPATIARLYYDPDVAPHAATPETMAQFLRTMRDALVQLALLADHLKASIRKHGSAKLTAVSLRMVEEASRLAAAVPAPQHAVGFWFRPLVAQRLAGQGIMTLQALVDYCNTHGGSWWRSVPRIGPLRARTLVTWLRRHEATLGTRVAADVDTRPLALTDEAVVIGGDPATPRLAPFERMAVPAALSGGDGGVGGVSARGTNRAGAFAFIRAPHDLAALHAYLHRYRDRPATLRVYTREIERFVLWAVIVRGVAVSSATVEDCEAYKDFLAQPAPAVTGPKRPRTSGRWRPFTGTLSADSQVVRGARAARRVPVARRGALSGGQPMARGARSGDHYPGTARAGRSRLAGHTLDAAAARARPRLFRGDRGNRGAPMAGRPCGDPADGRLGPAAQRGGPGHPRAAAAGRCPRQSAHWRGGRGDR